MWVHVKNELETRFCEVSTGESRYIPWREYRTSSVDMFDLYDGEMNEYGQFEAYFDKQVRENPAFIASFETYYESKEGLPNG